MLSNDITTSVKLSATTVQKLRLLKVLYQLKNIDAVVEHLLDEKGFAGKEICLRLESVK